MKAIFPAGDNDSLNQRRLETIAYQREQQLNLKKLQLEAI
jgi:hypothetical protein